MNEMKKSTVINPSDILENINRNKNALFRTVRSNRALIYGSAPKASMVGWGHHMAEDLEQTNYLLMAKKPAVESVADLIEQAYFEQHRSELGLKKMLEECFSMTNWYQILYSRYKKFMEEHEQDFAHINRDLLLTLETMLSLCINSYYQSTFVLHLKEAVDELNRVVAQAAEQ